MLSFFSRRNEKQKRLFAAIRAGNIRHIFMVRDQKIGDMITFLPTVEYVHSKFPDSKLTLACRPAGLPIAKRIPFVSTVDVDQIYRNGIKNSIPIDLLLPSSGDSSWIRLKKKLKIPFAVGILPDLLKGVCVKHRLQYMFLFDAVVRYNENSNVVDQNLRIIDLFGPTFQINRSLWTTKQERKFSFSVLSAGNSPRIIVSHVGSRPSRNWNPNHFAILCNMLISKTNASIYIIGKGDFAQKQAERICELMKEQPVSLVNKTDIGEMIALIESADLLISVDSSPAHVASYLNIPCITLFGPETFNQWGPWPQDMSLSRYFLSPCKCKPKDYNCQQKEHCMDSIKPLDVFAAAMDLLTKSN